MVYGIISSSTPNVGIAGGILATAEALTKPNPLAPEFIYSSEQWGNRRLRAIKAMLAELRFIPVSLISGVYFAVGKSRRSGKKSTE